MNHIQKTKRRLTYTFFFSILLIITLLWISFFSFRFIDGYRKDEREPITSQIDSATSKIQRIEIIYQTPLPQDHKPSFPPKTHGGKFEKRAPIPFTVIYDINGKVIQKDFGAEYEDNDILDELYQFKDQTSFQSTSGIGQFSPTDDGWKMLIFKPFRYPLPEFMADIALFLLFTLIFSIPLYLAIQAFINRTFAPVEENLKDMENFVHNAWHELKTPLSVVHGDLQMMQVKKIYEPQRVDEMIGEIDKLNLLIEGLVDMSNIHASSDNEEIEVYSEMQDVLKTYDSVLQEKNIQVELHKHANPKIRANRGYFHILLWNLISNAIKYNRVWWKIILTTNKQSVIVEDTGVWIEKIHHTKIWERFYKVQHGGIWWSWIWLSLVKKIADLYGWRIMVESEENKFTRFTIRLK